MCKILIHFTKKTTSNKKKLLQISHVAIRLFRNAQCTHLKTMENYTLESNWKCMQCIHCINHAHAHARNRYLHTAPVTILKMQCQRNIETSLYTNEIWASILKFKKAFTICANWTILLQASLRAISHKKIAEYWRIYLSIFANICKNRSILHTTFRSFFFEGDMTWLRLWLHFSN